MCKSVKVGDKIIAKKTEVYWGFRRGDTLEVIRLGDTPGSVIAQNLTRPNIRDGKRSILVSSDYKVVTSDCHCRVRTVKFLGITVYKETLEGCDK
jgi:hypothetical protein